MRSTNLLTCLLTENCCKFHIVKDERLVSKLEGKTSCFRGAWYSLTWLIVTPIFYDRSMPLVVTTTIRLRFDCNSIRPRYDRSTTWRPTFWPRPNCCCTRLDWTGSSSFLRVEGQRCEDVIFAVKFISHQIGGKKGFLTPSLYFSQMSYFSHFSSFFHHFFIIFLILTF